MGERYRSLRIALDSSLRQGGVPGDLAQSGGPLEERLQPHLHLLLRDGADPAVRVGGVETPLGAPQVEVIGGYVLEGRDRVSLRSAGDFPDERLV